jgi:hypothetical protein
MARRVQLIEMDGWIGDGRLSAYLSLRRPVLSCSGSHMWRLGEASQALLMLCVVLYCVVLQRCNLSCQAI